jgi:hypothetical protein
MLVLVEDAAEAPVEAPSGGTCCVRDWLSVIAGGPTGFLDHLPVKGETQWADNQARTALG